MMTQFDTRILQAKPDHLTQVGAHERTVTRVLRNARRARWQQLMARLLNAAPRDPKGAAPISPLS